MHKGSRGLIKIVLCLVLGLGGMMVFAIRQSISSGNKAGAVEVQVKSLEKQVEGVDKRVVETHLDVREIRDLQHQILRNSHAGGSE